MPTELEHQLQEAEITVEFADAREEELVRTAVLGQDARDFLDSQIGQFVLGAAHQDRLAIEEKLTRVSPMSLFGRRKIVKLQQDHEAIGMAVEWLLDAVRIGTDAERKLEEPTE